MRPLHIKRQISKCTWSWKIVKKKSLKSQIKVKTMTTVLSKYFQSTTIKLTLLMRTLIINLWGTQQTSAATKKTNNSSRMIFQSKKNRPIVPLLIYAPVMILERQCRVVPCKTIFYSVKLRYRHLHIRNRCMQA